MDEKIKNDLIDASVMDATLYASLRVYGYSSMDALAKCLLEMAKTARLQREAFENALRSSSAPMITIHGKELSLLRR